MIIEAINLLDLLDQAGESFVQTWLSSFSCKQNPEIEYYLKHNAINFAKKGISITYLIFGKEETTNYLLGYYAITYKILQVNRNNISRTVEKKIARFGEIDALSGSYSLPAPLIAQFGKNSSSPSAINGSEMMSLALDQVQRIQHMAGGRTVYLECEDNPFLLDFYTRNGFTPFAKRYTTEDEPVTFYHQLLKFLK